MYNVLRKPLRITHVPILDASDCFFQILTKSSWLWNVRFWLCCHGLSYCFGCVSSWNMMFWSIAGWWEMFPFTHISKKVVPILSSEFALETLYPMQMISQLGFLCLLLTRPFQIPVADQAGWVTCEHLQYCPICVPRSVWCGVWACQSTNGFQGRRHHHWSPPIKLCHLELRQFLLSLPSPS